MAKIRPWNKNGNAIVEATFGIGFSSAPPSHTVREILALHSKLSEKFPRKRETQGRLVGIVAGSDGGGAIVQAPQDMGLLGFTFDSLRSDGAVERSISLEDRKLSIVRADYEGWDKTWGEAREIFKLMLPIIMERSDVASLDLEFKDRFVFDGGRGEFKAEMVLRSENKFLVPNVFDVQDLWHSYHGFFDYKDQPHPHQLLNVIEVQLLPADTVGSADQPGLHLDLRLSHRCVPGVDKPAASGVVLSQLIELLGDGGAAAQLNAYMSEMHDANKALLKGLINDDMCARIGLKG